MNITVTPIFLEKFRYFRTGLSNLIEGDILKELSVCAPSKGYYKKQDNRKTRLIKELIRLGEDKATEDYCFDTKKPSFYNASIEKEAVRKNPFSYCYRVQDKKNGKKYPINSLSAFRAFDFAESHKLTFDVWAKPQVLDITNVNLTIESRLDAISGLKAFKIESTYIEPVFFNHYSRVDWKTYCLLYPELVSVIFSVFYFVVPGPSFSVIPKVGKAIDYLRRDTPTRSQQSKPCQFFEYEMYNTEAVRKEALENIEDFVYWIKLRKEIIKELYSTILIAPTYEWVGVNF